MAKKNPKRALQSTYGVTIDIQDQKGINGNQCSNTINVVYGIIYLREIWVKTRLPPVMRY